jgi:N-methylhydantoinase A
MERTGIDIGGTFTDLIAYDTATKELSVGKVPSTPADPSEGLITGLRDINLDPADISMLLHGTTVATNAVLEGTGGRCGLLTTAGFEDILELGWRDRPNLWGLGGEYEPIITRDNVYGIDERSHADGTIQRDLSEEQVHAAGERLLKDDVEAVVVSFLHSYQNPTNEQQAVEILKDKWPNPYVVGSTDILPEFREFERTSTAAITAYTQPVIASYLDGLEDSLSNQGFDQDVLLMQSNGGIAPSSVTKVRAANTILSGPAAGATAAAHLASATGYDNAISCDMGGTSFDVGLLPDGEPIMTQTTDLDYQLPLRVPMTDITAIGAGGGSIAYVDEGGILQVGPQSAGADPGPVCYGRGGTDITITDANLALKRLNPNNPIEEGLSLDLEYTRDVLAKEIAEPLDLSADEAARAVIDVGVNKMIGKIREVSIDKGYDPREFSLVTFGGAGPAHAGELIKKGDVPRAIIPYYPGILSAIGCLLADIRHDHVQSVNRQLSDLELEDLHKTIADLEGEGRNLLNDYDSPLNDVRTIYQSEMKYAGQAHTVTVSLPTATPTREEVQEQFSEAYLAKYAQEVDKPILIDNVHVTVMGITEKIDLQQLVKETGESLAAAQKDTRDVYFEDEWLKTPIYKREQIPLGTTFEGPAVIEQADTTTVINPGLTCRIDDYGNAILKEDGDIQ